MQRVTKKFTLRFHANDILRFIIFLYELSPIFDNNLKKKKIRYGKIIF